ncbi:MAG TPA: serine hydrolase domain-containing protein, partial [Chitinophagaceae bacterium]
SSIVRLPYAEGREFISIATIMMEDKGLLGLNDKVRKYFPKLPAWSDPVTIKDLLNHSSGFVDEWAVLLLTQASMNNRFDQSQFLNLLYNQPKPEIEPGKGYMYCNSDFGLLRLILENVSNENLSTWMQKNMFDPYGMKDTRLHDNKYEAIPNFAPFYYPIGRGKYNQWTIDKTSPGGNYHIATSLRDLEKWAAINRDKSSVPSKAINRLKQGAQLMPGIGKNYVFGIKEKELGDYNIIYHQGVNGHPYLSELPSKNLAVIMLGNQYANYPLFHQKIYEALLGIKSTKLAMKTFTPAPVKYTSAELKAFTGRYFDSEDTITYESFVKDRKNLLRVIVHNDSLKLDIGSGPFIPLIMYSPNVFKDPDYEAYLEFILPARKGEPVHMHTYVSQTNKVYYHIQDTSTLWTPSQKELAGFEGKYYSRHLDFYWTLMLNEDGKLVVKRPTIEDKQLYPETKDVFTLMVDKYPDDAFEVFVAFHRDTNGKITHFTVTDPRLKGHRFDRID